MSCTSCTDSRSWRCRSLILIALIVARQWKLLGAYAAAGILAVLPLSISSNRIAAPRWHFDLTDRLSTLPAQFLDDPRWIAMLAAVLTVSGPWLPARWRHWWWALLLAFVPIHLVISAIVPARSLVGLAVGWFVGALVVLAVGTPALEVPLEDAVRALAKRGCVVSRLTVVRPAGPGALVLSSDSGDPDCTAAIELYGPINAAVVRCANSGESCDCATPRPRPCRPRCAAPSSTVP